MHLFRGTYLHNIDDKGRLSVPGKFRDMIRSLDDQRLMLTWGTHKDCLALFTAPGWSRLEQQINDLPSSSRKDAFIRLFLAAGIECSMDKIGRILIPASMRAARGLKGEVMVMGALHKIEIWDRQRFDDYQAKNEAEALRLLDSEEISF